MSIKLFLSILIAVTSFSAASFTGAKKKCIEEEYGRDRNVSWSVRSLPDGGVAFINLNNNSGRELNGLTATFRYADGAQSNHRVEFISPLKNRDTVSEMLTILAKEVKSVRVRGIACN